MEQIFRAHIAEVQEHYRAGDFSLALRRMIDCAIETRNPTIFKDVLQYCQWLEEHESESQSEAARSKALEVLQHIANAGLKPLPEQTPRLLTVSKLSKKYFKGHFSLSNIDFTLDTGEIIGLVGENGNGKTTLLRLLSAELLPDDGSIEYNFHRDKGDRYGLKTKLVYIEQRIPRWYGSLMDNLQFTLAQYGMYGQENELWAELMIARLGLRPYRKLSWNRISSGYRTRFEIAKTLLRQPHILLLDEPLANLDILSQQTILQDLKFMSASITAPFGMMLSSQHIYEVEKVSDKIIFLKNGAPQYQQNKTAQELTPEPAALIFELETDNNREELLRAFGSLPLQKLQFNGGVFMAHFGQGTQSNAVLQQLAAHDIEVIYFRNISNSSRRFFIN